ncbi:DNA ligase [Vibrio mimicus]|uniref:DNA ligase n=1 Tax=Vibrio mimicus TaxID=674 RepID=UPI0003B1B0A3|nr:DNA ligase [Vibrio mimicus]ERM56494.1 DNA ligase [Vibrio mimicus CAIM 1883]ERM56676.1 DNA ligase [Vibrio mimicus CAIM 1882]
MLIRLTLTAAAILIASQQAMANDGPLAFIPITFANDYQHGINIYDYWKSEKLDGIRAIWTGKQLVTRNGNPISAPEWFTKPLPPYPLEGELWAGRGNFSLVQQTVLDSQPTESAWRQISFMLFDMPDAAGDYSKRYYNIVYLVGHLTQKHIKYVEHTPIQSEQELLSYLDNISGRSGEGVMLRKINARYQAGRSNDLLKLKKHQDAEATVIGYRLGSGKYKGKMGSILVRTSDGVEFYIGSGFSDAERADPPEIGSLITYRYNGLTTDGKPRFARFVRVRKIY